MTPLLTPHQLRQIELQYRSSQPCLMERAGSAAAHFIRQHYPSARRILVLAGPGNNGGDGVVCARELQRLAPEAQVYVLDACPDALRPEDARRAWQQWPGATLQAISQWSEYDLLVDALYGIGLTPPVREPMVELIAAANSSGLPILALDVPSGLDARTGLSTGSVINASATLNFIGFKTGLFTADAAAHTGRQALATLDLPEADSNIHLNQPAASALARHPNSHKGSHGGVAILGAAPGMFGAGLLAARSALLAGAGRVWLGTLDPRAPAADVQQPELMVLPANELLEQRAVTHWVVGPGLGQSQAAHQLLYQTLIRAPGPLLLDADALNLLASDHPLAHLASHYPHPLILTPHPGEAARLLDCTSAEVQADRYAALDALQQKYKACVLLKGNGSLIGMAGQVRVNACGNAALASAGQGDVLSGVIGALQAQGLEALDAAALGAWLHGQAADTWASRHGLIGLTASETAALIRQQLNLQVNQKYHSQRFY